MLHRCPKCKAGRLLIKKEPGNYTVWSCKVCKTFWEYDSNNKPVVIEG